MEPLDTGSPVGRTSTTERRRALVALLLLLPAPTIGTAASLLIWPDAILGKALFLITKLWILVLPFAWLRFVDREPVSWSPPKNGGFGAAVGSGILIGLVIFVAYPVSLKAGLIDPQIVADRAAETGLNQLNAYVAGAVYWITLNSLMEEYVWRWFVFRKFETLIHGRAAVIATSLAFTAHHVVALAAHFRGPMILLGSLGVCVGGLTWSWLYLRYRSIWPCYVSHAIVDTPIFLIGYHLIFAQG